jgi:hypothetical protein
MAERTLEDEALDALLVFAEMLANPKEVTERLVRAWVLVLRQAGIQPQEVGPAAVRLLATQTFFPTPADFLKAARPPDDREAAAELAWQRTLTCVRQIGRNASLHVSDLAGNGLALWVLSRIGWERLCAELTDENRAIWRADFIRLYRAGATTNAWLTYLPGLQERLNDAQGLDLTPILVGRPDWKRLPERGEQPALPAGEAAAPVALPAFAMIGRELPEDEGDPEIPSALRQKAKAWGVR